MATYIQSIPPQPEPFIPKEEGDYFTDICVDMALPIETPDDVIDVISAISRSDIGGSYLKDKPDKWRYLFSDNWDNPTTNQLIRSCDCYHLFAKGCIDNTDKDIEKFFDFVSPWSHAKNVFIGYYRLIQSRSPVIVYS